MTVLIMSSQPSITFYDVPSKVPDQACPSPNTWRTRLLLNYKRLPYTTVWVHFQDIETVSKSIGAPPTGKKPDGSDLYTVPFISVAFSASEPPVSVSDSLKIATYIENTFPDPARPLFPDGTRALQAAFRNHITCNIFAHGRPLFIATFADSLAKGEWYKKTREEVWFMKPLGALTPQGEKREETWKLVEKGFDDLAAFFNENAQEPSGDDEKRFSVMGGRPSYVELELVAFLHTLRMLSPDEGWPRLQNRNEGRWSKLLEMYKDCVGSY